MNKSAAKLEREVEASRDKLEDTISDLQSRLNLSSIRNGLPSARRSRAEVSSTVDRFIKSLRDDPVPILLIGAGLALLASDALKTRGNRRQREVTDEGKQSEASDRHLAGNHPDRLNEKLDDALEQSFPGSDPVSVKITR